MTKLLVPIIPDELETIDHDTRYLEVCRMEEERVHGRLFRNLICEEMDFSHMLITGVRFENCRFWNCSFERTEFTDVIFQACDISGCCLNDSYFNRASFLSCKGVGTKFAGSNLKNLLIKGCNFNYANLDGSKLESIWIRQTDLNSSNITQCKCKQVHWEEVKLTNASFFKTPLRGMDLSDSVIHGLVLSEDSSELKGVRVDLFQAAELAKRLGIVIKDVG